MRAAHPSFYLYYRKSCTIAKLTDTSSDALPCRHVPRWFNGLPCLHFDPQVLYLWLWLFSWLLQPRTLAEPLQSQLSSASLCPRPHFSYLSYRIKYRWWNKSMNTTFSPLNHKTVFPILKTHPHEVVNLKKKIKTKKCISNILNCLLIWFEGFSEDLGKNFLYGHESWGLGGFGGC